MNREIKFRAWETRYDKPRMIYSDEFSNETFWAVAEYDCEIMQYTGLKDKNGKEIYEGDIVKHYDDTLQNNLPWEIKFEIGVINDYGDTMLGWNMPPSATHKYIVIGNIYENPELLKK